VASKYWIFYARNAQQPRGVSQVLERILTPVAAGVQNSRRPTSVDDVDFGKSQSKEPNRAAYHSTKDLDFGHCGFETLIYSPTTNTST
jgi:hypothetical protein